MKTKLTKILLLGLFALFALSACKDQTTTTTTHTSTTTTTLPSGSTTTTTSTTTSSSVTPTTTTTPTTTSTSSETTASTAAPLPEITVPGAYDGEGDFSLPVNLHGLAFLGVTGNGIGSGDYSLSGGTLVLKVAYLAGLEDGDHVFHLFAGEADVPFTVTVERAYAPLLGFESGTAFFTQGVSESLSATLDLRGETLVSVEVDGVIIESTAYVFAEGHLVLSASVFATLAVGEGHQLSVTTSGGTAQAAFAVNDIPAIADKPDFIKYPGESVLGEDFRVLVTNQVGTLTYEITLVSGDGALTDHGNGTFDFVPATHLWGEAEIRITATDAYGASAARTVTLVFKRVDPSPIAPQEFRVSEPADLVIPVVLHGNEPSVFPVEFVSVSGEGIEAGDYVLDDFAATITLKQAFLLALGYGDHAFTVTTTAGAAEFHVLVRENPVLTLVSPDAVETPGQASDLVWTLDLRGASFTGLFEGDLALPESAYSFTEGTLVLKASFLDGRSAGPATFTVRTSSGSATLSVLLNDVPVFADKPDFIKFPGEAIHGEDFRPLVTDLYGTRAYAVALKTGSGTFVDHGDGTFDFTPAATAPGTVVFTFTVTDAYGAQAARDITLTYKTVNPVIYDADTKSVDKKDAFGDVVMTVDTFGTESSSLYFEMTGIALAGVPLPLEAYVLKTGGDPRLFSLKAAYLRSLPVGTYVFTLSTTAGSAEFSLDVFDTRPVTVDVALVNHVKTVDATDPVITLTLYANVITGADVAMTAEGFTLGTAFAYENGVLTLFHAYLDTLASGTYVVRILGEDEITVVIHDPTAPQVEASDRVTTVEKAAVSGSLAISVSLFGLEGETTVRFGEAILGSESVLVTGTGITLTETFLTSLAYGTHVFTVENSNGSDVFTLLVSDLPTASGESQNVTKFTWETISAEALRIQAAGDWSLTGYVLVSLNYYTYASDLSGDSLAGVIDASALSGSGAFGNLSIDPVTGTFALVRNPGWYGIVVFGYVAEDETGLVSETVTMDVHFLPVAPTIADSTGKTYDTVLSQEVVFTVTNATGTSDFPVWGIRHGSTWLVLGTDFLVGPHTGSDRFFTLPAAYLSTLGTGLQEFVLYTEGGSAAFSLLVVTPPACAEPEADFDKAVPADLLFAVTGYPLEITSVKAGSTVLDGTAWSYADGILTLKASWLSGRPYGTLGLTAGNALGTFGLTITILDSRTPALLSADPYYGKGSSAPVSLTLSLYDASFVSVAYGGTLLTAAEFSFAGGTLVLYGTYLETLVDAELSDLVFTFTTSENVIEITLAVHADVSLPELTASSDPFRIDEGNDVTYSVVTHDAVFAGLAYLGTPLTEGTDYAFEASTSTLTVNGSFLLSLYDFTHSSYSLTWKSEDGRDVNFTVAYDHPAARVVNGGFEAGTLYGWNVFGIWKNEAGMLSWTDDRVVSGTYFDQNYAYNREGLYNLGIYGGAITKDSAQERMGYLRSSDFVLGGSGWISFRLGGGKNPAFAYVSVRRSSDDVEIARFGNPRFNTVLAGVDNTEAYLFPYYFDLSAVGEIGESYYFLLTDAASNEWCVLSADSFRTYWEEAPVPGTGETAENILPVIQGIATATNAIVNGGFDTNLDGWTDVSGIFQISDGRLRSDLHGDADTGVLRSSAFTVNGNKYLRLDWNGGLKYDKQIFISVKEVGTNIEVLRFVRRENLSTYAGDGWDNALLDLSSLDSSKLYYLEIADNTASSWGLTMIHNVRFITETEYLSITSGDRAVSVAGLATDYPYTLPGE